MAIHAIPDNTVLVQGPFMPVESVGRSRYANGAAFDLTETMETVWRFDGETKPLVASAAADWRVWRHKLRGGLNLFTAYDITRTKPRNYPSAAASTGISGGWNGTATVTTLGAAGSLTLGGLPAGYVAKKDDRVGLEEGGRYDYYAVLADATANGSGAVTLTVSPYLRTGIFTTAAVARLWRPTPAFVLERWEEQRRGQLTVISFSGVQRI